MSNFVLQLKNITKIYPGVNALQEVSFQLEKGEVHALLGENGAGKSTFIKIITGAVKATEGEIYYKGEKLINANPSTTLKLGISAIYQEFTLLPNLSVAENLFYGCELKKGLFIDYRAMEEKSKEILSELGVNINPKTLVKDLRVGHQQIVEIARALIKDANLIIMDEPTASLTDGEINNLFNIVKKLKSKGVSIIYISHRLEEVFKIADRITVLRDGKHIITDNIEEFKENKLVEYMVGRELLGDYPERLNEIGKQIFKVNNLTTDSVQDISFTLNKGEILGFAGLVGSGRTEVARALFGADKLINGEIILNEKKVKINSPLDAIKNGIGFITEDRKNLGLMLDLSVKENLTFSSLNKITKGGAIDGSCEKKLCSEMADYLKIKTPSMKAKTRNLSGGNQQKVVIGKWLLTNSDILIFDEPTRGIDVGAKHEIYKIMRNLTKEGKSIIMISSEMPELIGMSDRVIVMSKGKIVSEYKKDEVTQEQIFMDSSSLL